MPLKLKGLVFGKKEKDLRDDKDEHDIVFFFFFFFPPAPITLHIQ